MRNWFNTFILGAALCAAPLSAAQASDTAQETIPAHGAVAMHGDIKYGDDFTHFDYVNPDAPKGGKLVLHSIGSFDSLNPFIIKGTKAEGVSFLGSSLLYAPLMAQSYDEPFTMYGYIAKSIKMPEDRSWVHFTLRDNAKWHDGTPITAADVEFTFHQMIEHGMPFFKAYYGDVEKVDVLSDHDIKFTFKNNLNAELPLILSQLTVLPKHYWEKDGNDISKTSLTPPLGSGPYSVKSVDAGRSLTYERVKDWWGADLPLNKGRYNFDLIQYDYYKDSNVALEAFLAGEYDIRLENSSLQWENGYNSPALSDGKIIKGEFDHQRPAGMQGFIYNIRRDVFKDIKVREAVSYAFDFEWANKQYAFGAYQRNQSYFENSELAAHDLPDATELAFLERYKGRIPDSVFTEVYKAPVTNGSGKDRKNMNIAKNILKDAGYVMGEDKILHHPETGAKLSFEILAVSPLMERWTLPFIKNLKRIGIEASFRIIDPAQYQNRVNAFDYDMIIGTIAQSESPGNEQRDFWNSAKADMQGSRNYIGVKSPVIDEIIEEIIQAPSRADLVARTRALDRILLANHYVVPQWFLNKWRIAYWAKLGHPEGLSPHTPAFTDLWWSKTEAQ
jgi:microcin C transport system substrate-binding protein